MIEQPFKVLVCGGREYNDREHLFTLLDFYHKEFTFTHLIHGGAAGADTLAGEWADSRNIRKTVYKADWKKYGKAAGPIRNKHMAKQKPDLVIAFPGTQGTAHMINTAHKFGIPVEELS